MAKKIKDVDVKAACLKDMADNGLGLPHGTWLIPDGKIHRYSIDGINRDEWYAARMGTTSELKPYLICRYASWKNDKWYLFDSSNGSDCFSNNELREIQDQSSELKEYLSEEARRQHDNSARVAYDLWNNYATDTFPTDDILPSSRKKRWQRYHERKGIESLGCKYMYYEGKCAVVIDIVNSSGDIRSLQFIWVEDSGEVFKRFLKGGEKKGNFKPLGTLLDAEPIYVVEGYATGVSVYLAVQSPTVIALDAGNISSVIASLKLKYPNSPIVIAGDADDAGREAVKKAVKKYGCAEVFPLQPHKDFNDVHGALSIQEVQKQLGLLC